MLSNLVCGHTAVPFPTRQLVVLALCRICEPIAFMSIFPYVYYMISSFDMTSDERQISFYVGLVTSAFAVAEFSTSVLWGRLSDRIGRKPVLIMGLAGTAVSMIVFGLAPNLPMALLGRALGGALNGNIGVLQTTVAEIVTVKEHQPRAYAIMPFVWCLGSILGPALGGTLAQPCEHYPSVFGDASIFARFPFLLPNLVCVAVLVCGILVGILFLEETHPEMKKRRDFGLEIGRRIIDVCVDIEKLGFDASAGKSDCEVAGLLQDVPPPDYRTSEASPRVSLALPARRCASQRAFTRPVVLNIVGYGLLAYISFDQLMPIFLAEPDTDKHVSLPFKFVGGFGYSAKTIGFMLAIQGIYSMIAQLFVFPICAKRFGTLATFRFVIMTWPLLYFLVPYVVLLPVGQQKLAVYVCLCWKITAHVMAFPSNNILLTNSAPSTLVLGLINGVAASSASLARTLGPTLTGLVHTQGLKLGYTGLAWWVSGLVCLVGAVESLWIEEASGRMDCDPTDEEAGSRMDCELSVESAPPAGDTTCLLEKVALA